MQDQQTQTSLGTIGLTMGVAAIGAEALVISPLLEDVAREFGTSPGDLGTAVAAYGFAVAIAAPLLGYAGQRLPRIAMMAASMIVFVLASCACALATNVFHLEMARAVCGIAAGGFLPACYAFVADSVSYDRRAKVMGRVMFGWALSMVVGVPLGGAIGQWFGWRAAFVAVAVIGTIAVSIILVRHGARGRIGGQGSVVSRKLPTPVRKTFVLTFLNMLSFYGVYTYLGTAVRSAQEIGSGVAAAYVLLYGLGLATSTLRGDILDRIGKLRALRIGLLALCPFFVALPFSVQIPWALGPLMIAWGLLQGAVLTGLTTVVTQQAGEARAFATAINSSITYVAVALSAELGGWVMKDFGGFPAVCVAAAVANILARFFVQTNEAAPNPNRAIGKV